MQLNNQVVIFYKQKSGENRKKPPFAGGFSFYNSNLNLL